MFCSCPQGMWGGILAPQSGTEPPVLEGKIVTTGLQKSPLWPFTENVDWPPNQNCFIRRGLWLERTVPDHRRPSQCQSIWFGGYLFGREDLSACHLRRWLILWSKAGEGGMLHGCWDQLREMGRKRRSGWEDSALRRIRKTGPDLLLSQVAVARGCSAGPLGRENAPVHGGRGPGNHGVPLMPVSSAGVMAWGEQLRRRRLGEHLNSKSSQWIRSTGSWTNGRHPQLLQVQTFLLYRNLSPPPPPTDPSCFFLLGASLSQYDVI